jgi:hypothetical protein
MSCCGKARAIAAAAAGGGARPASVSPPASTPFSVIVFELVGRGPATVVGPVSGTRYRFTGPGDRVRVDPRDRPGLAARAELRWVR